MATLALSMIVRDAASMLRTCLESAKGVADEIVIADTGSTDATLAIAREFGARTVSIPWENDFAKARNRALAEVRSDWVLVLDADEVLDPRAPELLPSLLRAPVAGYQVTIRNYVTSMEVRLWDRPAQRNDASLPAAQGYPAFVEHENVRLFRRQKDVYFIGCVHESVGRSIEQNGLRLQKASFLIHHFGLAADAQTKSKKDLLYYEMGKEKIRRMPHDGQAQFELGLLELEYLGKPSEALVRFQRACELNPRLAVAWLFSGLSLIRLERYREALPYLKRADALGNTHALVAESAGDAYYSLGDFKQAIKKFKLALQRQPDNPFVTSKLGLATLRSGKAQEGLTVLRQAVRERPSLAPLHDRLIQALVWLGRLSEAAISAEAKLQAVTPEPKDFLRAASLWAKQGDQGRAAAMLAAGSKAFPSHAIFAAPGDALSLSAANSGTSGTKVRSHLADETVDCEPVP